MTQPSYEQYRTVANRLTQLHHRTASENFQFPSIDAAIEWCFTYLEIPEDNKWRFTRPDITKPIAPMQSRHSTESSTKRAVLASVL